MVEDSTGKKKVLLSLVSQQAMPIVTAILQYGSNFDRYDFLITDEYKDVADRIINFLDNRKMPESESVNISPEIIRCRPYDTKNAKEVIDEYVRKWKDDYDIVINITNGTKLMSIAGYCAAIENNLEYIYVESKKRHLIRGNLSSGAETSFPFDETKFKEINVEKYLELNGNKIKPIEEISADRTEQSKTIRKHMDEFNASRFFISLKKYFQDIYENKKFTGRYECNIYDDLSCPVSLDDRKLLSNLNNVGILKFRDEDDIVSFASEEDFRFFNGSWLEIYSKYLLDSSGMFDDVRTNLTFIVNEKEKKDPINTNEWDVFVVAQGKFALIECKSSSPKDIDKYGKLKSAQNMIKGENSSAFLISFKPIDSKAEIYRELFKIEVIDKTKLDNMAEIIADSMNLK